MAGPGRAYALIAAVSRRGRGVACHRRISLSRSRLSDRDGWRSTREKGREAGTVGLGGGG